jgi:hypothetical protein
VRPLPRATLEAAPPPPTAAATQAELRAAVRAAAPQLNEGLRWGQLCFLDPQGRVVVCLIPYTHHVNLQILRGAELSARFRELEGSGKALRHLKCYYDRQVDRDLVARLVRAALELE